MLVLSNSPTSFLNHPGEALLPPTWCLCNSFIKNCGSFRTTALSHPQTPGCMEFIVLFKELLLVPSSVGKEGLGTLCHQDRRRVHRRAGFVKDHVRGPLDTCRTTRSEAFRARKGGRPHAPTTHTLIRHHQLLPIPDVLGRTWRVVSRRCRAHLKPALPSIVL